MGEKSLEENNIDSKTNNIKVRKTDDPNYFNDYYHNKLKNNITICKYCNTKFVSLNKNRHYKTVKCQIHKKYLTMCNND